MTDSPAPWEGKLYSNGWTAGSGASIEVTEKATNAVLGTVATATSADLDAAVTAASAAQKDWAALPYPARASVLRRAAHLLATEPERLAPWLIREAGSSQGKAGFEVMLVTTELEEAAATASAPYGEILRSMKPRLSMARYVPYGVVGVISPFNFPGILSMRSVAPALALGNAVILKPDPRTPVAGGMAIARLLADAGLPEGLLHVLPGDAELGKALVAHPGVPCISFTGSTAAGRHIGQEAGGQLKQIHLELGGNNALLVLPDADIEAAASAGAWGSFLHQGQICMTTGRHLVHRSMADEYVRLLAEKASQLPVGDPMDASNALGPLIDARQRDRVDGLVKDALASGATLEAGGTYEELFYRPTVLSNVTTDSPVFTQEIFGPVAPVTVYDDVEEAIDIINSNEYGLSVGILTANAFAAFALADRIDAGLIHINDQTIDDEAVAPFGGTKASGTGGHFGGARASLDTFCHQQWVTVQADIERYPF